MQDDAESPEPSPTGAVVEVLVRNHRAFLSFLELRVGNRSLAEDLLQEAFVRGLNGLPALTQEEAAVGWFYRILRNIVVDQHRRSGAAGRQLEAFAVEEGRFCSHW